MKTKNKDKYIANRAAELKEWSAQIDLLAAKTEKSVGVVKLKYLPELNLLRAKQHAAFEMMQELENASDDAWGVKESAEQVWDELRASLANAALIFN